MTTNNEAIHTDILWEEMKNLAIEQQQCFYEFLPDCKIYQHDEHKYLKYDIGYTIYGPPKIEKNASKIENNDVSSDIQENKNEDQDIADIAAYDKKRDVIVIYNKILECTKETVDSQTIYFSIIYNIIFRPKIKSNVKKKQNVKTEVEKKIPDTEEKEKKEKKEFMVLPVPVFKIRKRTQLKTKKNVKEEKTLLTEPEADYTTCYIDNSGRVYKDWTDYITKNTLPQCTMVIPKDGDYQPDISQPITEDYSTVWLDIIDSPACKLTTKLCKGIDIVNGVIGVGTVGLGIASLFTPLAPVVALSGLVAAGTTSAWSVGRSSQRLYDHKTHEGSLLDKEALPQWLGIAGTTLGAVGGTLYISTVIEHGVAISNSTRIVFNTIQGGNILLNGVCIAHQIYSIIDKHGTIIIENIIDWLAHIMFFNNFVINIKFAEIIIKDTEDKIIDDYRQSLPNRRFREAYNRVRRNATAENSGREISENAQVIHYVTNSTQLLSSDNFSSNNSTIDQTSSKSSVNAVWSFENNTLRINGIVLFDPIEFTKHLKQLDMLHECNQDSVNARTFSRNYDNDINERLLKILSDLLTQFYLSTDCPKSGNLPNIFDFEPFLKELTSMNINEDFLSKLFTITAKLVKHSKNTEDFLLKAFYFIWMYCKENLKQWGINSCYRMQSIAVSNLLKKIIIAVFEAIDMMIVNLNIAFTDYIAASLYN